MRLFPALLSVYFVSRACLLAWRVESGEDTPEREEERRSDRGGEGEIGRTCSHVASRLIGVGVFFSDGGREVVGQMRPRRGPGPARLRRCCYLGFSHMCSRQETRAGNGDTACDVCQGETGVNTPTQTHTHAITHTVHTRIYRQVHTCTFCKHTLTLNTHSHTDINKHVHTHGHMYP